MIKEIVEAVTIPVMAKVRIGHFVEAQVSLSDYLVIQTLFYPRCTVQRDILPVRRSSIPHTLHSLRLFWSVRSSHSVLLRHRLPMIDNYENRSFNPLVSITLMNPRSSRLLTMNTTSTNTISKFRSYVVLAIWAKRSVVSPKEPPSSAQKAKPAQATSSRL